MENKGKLWLGFDWGSVRSVCEYVRRDKQADTEHIVVLTMPKLTWGKGWLISLVVPIEGGSA